jgi:hypothetical protein
MQFSDAGKQGNSSEIDSAGASGLVRGLEVSSTSPQPPPLPSPIGNVTDRGRRVCTKANKSMRNSRDVATEIHIFLRPNFDLTTRRNAWHWFEFLVTFHLTFEGDAFWVVFVKPLLCRFCRSEDL